MATGVHDERYRLLIDRLKDARLERRMTQEALAQQLGKHQQFVSKVESRERRLDVIEFVEIARILGFDWHLELSKLIIPSIPRS